MLLLQALKNRMIKNLNKEISIIYKKRLMCLWLVFCKPWNFTFAVVQLVNAQS